MKRPTTPFVARNLPRKIASASQCDTAFYQRVVIAILLGQWSIDIVLVCRRLRIYCVVVSTGMMMPVRVFVSFYLFFTCSLRFLRQLQLTADGNCHVLKPWQIEQIEGHKRRRSSPKSRQASEQEGVLQSRSSTYAFCVRNISSTSKASTMLS